MGTPSIEELTAIARALALDLSPERLQVLLPEVQRLWEAARRLRELPLESEEFGTRVLPE